MQKVTLQNVFCNLFFSYDYDFFTFVLLCISSLFPVEALPFLTSFITFLFGDFSLKKEGDVLEVLRVLLWCFW